MGDPYDFGVVKSYPEWKKWLKKIPQKNLKDWTKWNRKIGGRSFNMTSGAFRDTLLYNTHRGSSMQVCGRALSEFPTSPLQLLQPVQPDTVTLREGFKKKH